MHLLFLSHYFPPEVNAPATRTYEFCKRWVAAGHKVTVITCAPNCPSGVVFPGYQNAWRREDNVDGIRVIRVWTCLAANKGCIRRIVSFLSYMVTATLCAVRLRDVDVVIGSSPQFFAAWAGAFCHWLRGWPFVGEIRDIWPEGIVVTGAMHRSPFIRLLEWMERRLYQSADHIVTVGNGYRQLLLDRDVPDQNISIVTNGVDCSKFGDAANADAIRRQWNPDDKFVCAYVGTVGLSHGLEVMLQAAEQLQRIGRTDVDFWIVGDGARREPLQAEASQRGLTNVHFLGMVPKERIAQVIAACDACLVHLRGAKFFSTVIPSKIFEIMASSVPIIMGVRGEALEIVERTRAGIAMVPDDPESLLHCIDRVASNRAEFSNGRDYVQQHFSHDTLATKMLNVCQRVVNSKRGRDRSSGHDQRRLEPATDRPDAKAA